LPKNGLGKRHKAIKSIKRADYKERTNYWTDFKKKKEKQFGSTFFGISNDFFIFQKRKQEFLRIVLRHGIVVQDI